MLRAPIASGGMAQVWQADDLVLGRRVAVKLLHPHLTGEPAFVERFRNEAKAAARLSHASIVSIFDTASDGDIEAIVMELIDGMTLRQFLDDYGALSIEDAVELTVHVADALDAAHQARIIHRDIKPGNIMLCPDRRVKVTDFGIAKALEGGDHTTKGTLLGTAKYLAPEQVTGGPVDARADVYSLAVVLYESLVGTPPFLEDTHSATALARLQRNPVPPRRLRPEIPPTVERVMLRALATKPDDRYPTALAFRDALTTALAAPPEPSVDPTTPLAVVLPDAAASGTAGRRPGPVRVRDAVDDERPRRSLLPLVVGAVVVAALTLGLVLIFGTEAGQDFLDRIGDDPPTATTGDGDDTPTTTTASDDGATSGADDAPTSEPDPADAAPGVEGAGGFRLTDFDPAGDDVEHPELLDNLLDGNPSTLWVTESYGNRALGNIKPGVGVLFELDQEQTLTALRVVTASSGWAGSVYIADTASTDLADWGEPIDERSGVDGSTTFELRGVRGAAVLMWFTDLGDAPPPVRLEIGEMELVVG